MEKNHYEVLNVNHTATLDEIKKSYKKLVFQYHPDRNQGSKESEEKFKIITNSYNVLSNPFKRREYDIQLDSKSKFKQTRNTREQETRSNNNNDDLDINLENFENILSSLFEIYNKSNYAKKETKNTEDLNKKKSIIKETIEKSVNLTLSEAYMGVVKVIKFSYKDTCSDCLGSGKVNFDKKTKCWSCLGSGYINNHWCNHCSGTGVVNKTMECHTCRGRGKSIQQMNIQIRIPKGVENNDVLNIENDFFKIKLKVHIKNLGKFEIRGQDLYMVKKIPLEKYNKIKSLPINLLSGQKVKVKIPNLNQLNNQTINLKLANKGMPYKKDNTKFGDLFLRIEITNS